MNHSPISFHKHFHTSGLLNEGCSMICCVAAHPGQEFLSLSSAICYEWRRLLCIFHFWLWISSWLTRGCLPSGICGTQCNKCFSVAHFCFKKNQSFASTHWLGNVLHSCFDPAPFLSHSCFWDGFMGGKAAPLNSCASGLGYLKATYKAETQPCVVGIPGSTVPSSQSLTNLLFLTWKQLNFRAAITCNCHPPGKRE